MKLALFSDLHTELDSNNGHDSWQPPDLDADLVLLAGDVGLHTFGLRWASESFRRWKRPPRLAYVAGNHEYYHAHLGLISELRRPAWESVGVTFLERRTLELPGLRVLGCTLWSDFGLYGAERRGAAMAASNKGIYDFEVIAGRGGRLIQPLDVLHLHRTATAWLDAELAKPYPGKTVVLTHFAPHPICVSSKYQGNPLTPFFVCDLRWLLEKHRIDLWAFGHTHHNVDVVVEGGTRLISNQRGYPTETAQIAFRPNLVIEC